MEVTKQFELGSTVDLIMISVIIVLSVFLLTFLYLTKVKKVMAKEEKINHARFSRTDSTDYIKFDNIMESKNGISGDKYGVVIMPKNVFIAGLDIQGYNFASASSDEQKRSMVNAVALFNFVEKPLQFRQTVKAIDLSYNIEKHLQVCQKLEMKYMDLMDEYDQTVKMKDTYKDSIELEEAVHQKLALILKELSSTKWKMEEGKAVLDYLKGLEVHSGKSQKINQLLFSYKYDPNDFSEELSENEIYSKAAVELANMGGIYASALENCGCRVRFLNGMEMLDLFRRHAHPATADDVKIEELFNSSLPALFVTSDSLLKLEQDRQAEAQLQKRIEDFEKKRAKALEDTKKNMDEYARRLNEATADYVNSLDYAEEERV